MIWPWIETSRAETGSSQTMKDGSSASARDADALALAAGELVRVALGHVGKEADLGQQLGDALLDARRIRFDPVDRQRLADDLADEIGRAHV